MNENDDLTITFEEHDAHSESFIQYLPEGVTDKYFEAAANDQMHFVSLCLIQFVKRLTLEEAKKLDSKEFTEPCFENDYLDNPFGFEKASKFMFPFNEPYTAYDWADKYYKIMQLNLVESKLKENKNEKVSKFFFIFETCM